MMAAFSQSKLARSRRSFFKAMSITAGAVAAVAIPRKEASANPNPGAFGQQGCFARGSKVLTADGYRPVETLVIGDRLATRFGGLSSIRATASFTLERAGPKGSWVGASRPVRVKAGALGENSPSRDLVLTSAHALFVDGVLVPAIDLVNGTSIVLETADDIERLEFFHVALAKHDVIDAEGAACESLRDAAVEEPCVPLLGFHGKRDALRSRLRSAAAIVVDRRQPLDIIRDTLEERGLEWHRLQGTPGRNQAPVPLA